MFLPRQRRFLRQVQGFLYGHQVAQGLAHLVFAQLEQAGVHPVPGERHLTGGSLALGDLVLVVGEDQVLAAAVDV